MMQIMSEKDRGRELTQADYIRVAVSDIDRAAHYPGEVHVPDEAISLGWDDHGVWHERTLDFQPAKSDTGETEYHPRYVKTDGERREGYVLWQHDEVWHLPQFGDPYRGGRITRRYMRADLEWFLDTIRRKPKYMHLAVFRPAPKTN
jgi:hypothetical protein